MLPSIYLFNSLSIFKFCCRNDTVYSVYFQHIYEINMLKVHAVSVFMAFIGAQFLVERAHKP